jgi:hypothetical protein
MNFIVISTLGKQKCKLFVSSEFNFIILWFMIKDSIELVDSQKEVNKIVRKYWKGNKYSFKLLCWTFYVFVAGYQIF